jgi:hypothetical protein
MLRRTLLPSIALSVALAMLGATNASAARTTVHVRGEVQAIALAGDALIVARQPQKGGLLVERLKPGAAAQTLVRLPRSHSGDDQFEVTLAGSAQALAVSVQEDTSGDSNPSRVFAGPSSGPLREVATCAAGLLLPPVAVLGSSIAWVEGGCGEPAGSPLSATPASIVIGGADASVSLRRVPAGEETLPATIVLNGEGGLAGLVRPSLFAFFKSEVRRFGPGGLGGTLASEPARIVAPVGVLSSGDTVLFRGGLENDGGDGDSSSTRCDSTLSVIASGGGAQRTLPLGGCPGGQDSTGGPNAQVAGERVFALVKGRSNANSALPTAAAVASVRGDGSDARLFARGTYRAPLGLAAGEPERVAWWEHRCSGGTEIVTDDGAPPASTPSVPACTVKLLQRSARVHGGRITLRLRCPFGCSGQVIGGRRGTPAGRSFSFERGTHSLRLRLTRRAKPKRVRVAFEVTDGPSRSAVVRLR